MEKDNLKVAIGQEMSDLLGKVKEREDEVAEFGDFHLIREVKMIKRHLYRLMDLWVLYEKNLPWN